VASLRHRVRTLALQALFELDATDHAPDEVVARWVEDELLPPEGERFLRQLIFGVWEHYSYLDRIIEGAAPSWPVNQMPGVDKAILRIALFEILIDETEKTPVKAVINEAVELAKQFGSDNSSRFVNGVLGTVVTRYIEGSGERGPGAGDRESGTAGSELDDPYDV
jgi:N utilization substance protein B